MSVSSMKDSYNKDLQNQVEQEKAAVSLINSIGTLLYDNSVELVLFRNHLVDTSVSEVLKLHKYGNEVVKKSFSVYDTAALAKVMVSMDLAPAKVDIGKLAAEWNEEKENYENMSAFVGDKIGSFSSANAHTEPRDVVLFGFGRIGRLAARELIKQFGKGQQLRLRAIVTRDDSEATITKRAALFRNDSVHGHFSGTVEEDMSNKALVINGQRIQMIGSKDPGAIDYTAYGIENAILLDNTGAFTNREALSVHMKAKGIAKVILTAPGKEIPNIVYGINHFDLDIENETIFSAASCTTNAISPVLKVINDAFGIEKGHIETVHAYTNDQNLLDNMHKKPRRGRSAAINMVITSTGAGAAVTKVIPDLKDKLTANAVRVPTPNGSLAIMSLELKNDASVEALNEAVRNAALEGNLVNQINYNVDPELVSNDIIGNACCSVFDSNATLVHPDGKSVVLYTWYDNEFGYTKQVIRLAKYVAKVRRLHYY